MEVKWKLKTVLQLHCFQNVSPPTTFQEETLCKEDGRGYAGVTFLLDKWNVFLNSAIFDLSSDFNISVYCITSAEPEWVTSSLEWTQNFSQQTAETPPPSDAESQFFQKNIQTGF